MIRYNRLGGDDDLHGRGGRFSWRSSRRLPEMIASATVATIEFGRGVSPEIHQLSDERRQLVFRVRREIAEGVYETPEKMQIAFERLFNRLIDDVD